MADAEAPAAPAPAPEAPPAAPAPPAEAPPAAQPGPRGEAPPVPSVGRQRSTTHTDARSTLRDAFARTRPPRDRGDSPQAAVVSSDQETAAPGGPPPAAPSPTPETAEASAQAPGEGEAPAAGPPPGEAASPAQATATPPAPSTQTATAPPPGDPGLPERYLADDLQARYERDPLLKGNLRRLWLRSDLPEYERGERMAKLVEKSDADWQAKQNQAAYRQKLRRENRLAEWADAVDAEEQAQEQSQEWAQGVTRILAAAYGVEPDDPGFVNAGQGATPEEQVANFADWAEQRSARNQSYVQRRLAEQAQDYEGRIATLQAEHQQALKELESRLSKEGEAQATRREAQARGGLPAPPRAPAGGAPAAGPQAWEPPTINTIRGSLAEGFRQRRAAQAQQ